LSWLRVVDPVLHRFPNFVFAFCIKNELEWSGRRKSLVRVFRAPIKGTLLAHPFTKTLIDRVLLCALAGLAPAWLATGVMHAQATPRPHITGISQIALFAHDYEKSRAYYGQVLGFEEPYSLKNPDGSPIMTFFKVNDHQYIELSPEVAPATDRLNHVSLETDDIEAMRKYLKSRGVTVPDKLHANRIGNISFDVIDPSGHKVEMVQYMASGKTMQNYGKFLGPNRASDHMTHVGLVVTKLDPEYKFYTDILGFKETWRGSSTGKVLSWINLKVPDGNDYVEFMLSKDEPAPTDRGTQHHLCLRVPDVPAGLEMLRSRVAKQDYQRPLETHVGINRKRISNFFDPDGTRTELMEPTTIDGKPTPPSTAPIP
jgi:catechol 2,3-dioxygenase-like lactoylglutathione lyase family enzyme